MEAERRGSRQIRPSELLERCGIEDEEIGGRPFGVKYEGQQYAVVGIVGITLSDEDRLARVLPRDVPASGAPKYGVDAHDVTVKSVPRRRKAGSVSNTGRPAVAPVVVDRREFDGAVGKEFAIGMGPPGRQAIAPELRMRVLDDAAIIGKAADAVAGSHLRVEVKLIAKAAPVIGRAIDDDVTPVFERVRLMIGDEGISLPGAGERAVALRENQKARARPDFQRSASANGAPPNSASGSGFFIGLSSRTT